MARRISAMVCAMEIPNASPLLFYRSVGVIGSKAMALGISTDVSWNATRDAADP
jgi:hypothetical protein